MASAKIRADACRRVYLNPKIVLSALCVVIARDWFPQARRRTPHALCAGVHASAASAGFVLVCFFRSRRYTPLSLSV